ncbi:hypothetical protein PISMIDRAFT_683235 [Pisolithus microcarpus 441]|uniref:Uncharacterized protein n=1 Tax=Pisolithus microcarpus 441 TaxID=765257 RepID=A0A0C9ZHB2_9AGAM|nr:hypothetical protein PISMIDRAFT_683235 [Pisolithus microcarpus 441]
MREVPDLGTTNPAKTLAKVMAFWQDSLLDRRNGYNSTVSRLFAPRSKQAHHR